MTRRSPIDVFDHDAPVMPMLFAAY